MAGRRPLPTALKILRGNPGKRPLKPTAELPAVATLPRCPRHLRGIAREAWVSLSRQLAALRVVTAADLGALELLVSAYAEYRHARAVVERRGATYTTRTARGMIVRRRPEVAIAADAWKRCRSMLVEFGLTPAARPRAALGTPAGSADAPAGRFAAWLASRRGG